MGFHREHFGVWRTPSARMDVHVSACVWVALTQSTLPLFPKCREVRTTRRGNGGGGKLWKSRGIVYPGLCKCSQSGKIRTKEGGRKSTIQKVKCINAIWWGKGWSPYKTVTKRCSFLWDKHWLKLADKYFMWDLKQFATNKTKIPRGQYIINNLKMWLPLIVSEGARKEAHPKSKKTEFPY